MKSFGGLFEVIVAPENLAAALARAARGKRCRGPVSRFLADAEAELALLGEELRNGAYRPRPFTQFRIWDPKPRLVSCADFRDRVVHHALCARVAPIIERRLIADNYACRVGKGSHRAVLRAFGFARRFHYWMRTDVRHYYENIDHDLLLSKLCAATTTAPRPPGSRLSSRRDHGRKVTGVRTIHERSPEVPRLWRASGKTASGLCVAVAQERSPEEGRTQGTVEQRIEPGEPGRQLEERLRVELPGGVPQQERPFQPQRQPGFPPREHND